MVVVCGPTVLVVDLAVELDDGLTPVVDPDVARVDKVVDVNFDVKTVDEAEEVRTGEVDVEREDELRVVDGVGVVLVELLVVDLVVERDEELLVVNGVGVVLVDVFVVDFDVEREDELIVVECVDELLGALVVDRAVEVEGETVVGLRVVSEDAVRTFSNDLLAQSM